MYTNVKIAAGRETTRALLEQIVRGERGRQLRAKVASLNVDIDRSRVDDAFQTACERAGRSCRGQTEGEVYQWLYTTMMRELGAARSVLQREEPVDWSTESLARFRRCEVSVADEIAEREAEGELVALTTRVLDDLTERQRAVAVLYSHGLPRKEIAAQLDVTPRIVKRSLEQLLSSGRRRLIRLAGGGCSDGEALVARCAFGLGSQRDIHRAREHLERCPQCSALHARLDVWRAHVAATVPIPAVTGTHSELPQRLAQIAADLVGGPAEEVSRAAAPRGHIGGLVAHLREHANSLYVRAVDPMPLAGARPGTVAATIAGCVAVGSGAGYCVERNVDLRPIARLAGIAVSADKHDRDKHRPRRTRAAATAPIAVPPPAPTPTEAATPATAPPPPVASAPEEEFEPTSASAASAQTTAAAPIARREPQPVPANAPPEFGGP